MLYGHKELPNRITKKAHNLLKFSNSVPEKDKVIMRQYQYIKEHGDFKVETQKTEDELICSFYIDDKKYDSNIPLKYNELISEVYPFGEVMFKDVELMAVSLQKQTDWANETFYASYWGTPIKIKDEGEFKDIEEDWVKNKIRILAQFYVPRELLSDDVPLDEIVTDNSNEFLPIDIRNYTRCKTPNPWIKYSMGVIYENENLANKLFNHEQIHNSKEKYHVTPPKDMPIPQQE